MRTNGILVVDKPAGISSRKATNRVSRLLSEKKAGHLGTLDPIATGVLPVALGKATRLIRFLEKDHKLYRGTVRLGQATDTQDSTGKVVFQGNPSGLTPRDVEEALAKFEGEITQLPPMHSAKKVGGKPLYKLARQGIEVEREPRKVTIFKASVESADLPLVTILVKCEPGTYMRTLANDLGQALGCGGHLASLVRLESGPFAIQQAVSLDGLTPEAAREKLIPLAECLPHFPAIKISRGQETMIRDGVAIEAPQLAAVEPGKKYRLIRESRLVAVAQGIEHGKNPLLRPLRVMP